MFVRALPASSVPASVNSAAVRYIRPVSSETANYSTDKTEQPVSMPVQKLGAVIQAAGEAQYTFDVKQSRDGLMGSLAVTMQASGIITKVDTSAAAGRCGDAVGNAVGNAVGTHA